MNVFLKFLLFSFFLAFSYLVITYLVCYDMIGGGLSTKELTLFGLIIGVIFLLLSLVGSTVFLFRYKRDCLSNNSSYLRSFYQFGLILLFSLGFTVLLDTIYFMLIDKSVPKAFANSISDFLLNNGQSEEAVEGLSELPLMLQNFFTIVIGGLVGIPIAILISGSLARGMTKKQDDFA